MVTDNDSRSKIGFKVSVTTIVANCLLSIIKVAIGIVGKSNAMIADGIHSFSDVITCCELWCRS